MAMIKISQRKQHMYTVGIYRLASGILEGNLNIISTVMKEPRSENNSLIMLGDINVTILKHTKC